MFEFDGFGGRLKCCCDDHDGQTPANPSQQQLPLGTRTIIAQRCHRTMTMEQGGERVNDDIANQDSDSDSDDDLYGIECVDLTEETLRRLQRNDCSIAGLKIQAESWIAGTGIAIANSSCLKMLEIEVKSDGHWLAELSAWLTCNESIISLEMRFDTDQISSTSDILGLFAPFVMNNRKLRSIYAINFGDNTHSLSSLALALANRKGDRLERISTIWGRSARDEEVADLFRSLIGKPRLSEICFRYNRLGRMGCRTLANLLTYQSSNIQSLDFQRTDIDNDNMAILCDAIIKNNTLRKLSMCRVSISGCVSLSKLLSYPMSTLECLCLFSTTIEDEGIGFLGEALANNNRLIRLSLVGDVSITLAGWKAFSKCFEARHSSLDYLCLDDCHICDDGVAGIATSLAANTTLTTLEMGGNDHITSTGVVALFHLIARDPLRLERIYVSGNNVDIEGTKTTSGE